jgi:hypothetical protein
VIIAIAYIRKLSQNKKKITIEFKSKKKLHDSSTFSFSKSDVNRVFQVLSEIRSPQFSPEKVKKMSESDKNALSSPLGTDEEPVLSPKDWKHILPSKLPVFAAF